VLQAFSEQGHCAVPQEQLVAAAEQLLTVDAPLIAQALGLEVTQGHVVAETIRDQPCVFLAPLHRAELGVAAHLRRLLAQPPPWAPIAADKAVPWVERQTGVTLSASQRAAVAQTVNAKVTIVTGGPGVGKTTVVNSILRILRAKGVRGSCSQIVDDRN
jgi:exodeoxyribonuclease V alpha subunit